MATETTVLGLCEAIQHFLEAGSVAAESLPTSPELVVALVPGDDVLRRLFDGRSKVTIVLNAVPAEMMDLAVHGG